MHSIIRPTVRGPALIITLALLGGSNFAWIKIALDAFSPVQLTFARLLLGALVLVAVVEISHDRLPRDRQTWLHVGVAALLSNTAPYLLFAFGETRIDSSIAGVLNTTTPLWTIALVAATCHTETVRPVQFTGFVFGLAGCVILFAPWNSDGIDLLGVVYCLLAAALNAFSYVYIARYLTPKSITPTVLATAQLLAATGWALIALVSSPGAVPAFAPGPWAALVILGVLGTGLAYIVNFALIRHEGPTRTSAVTYLIPLVSLAIGTVALDEPLTSHLLAGSALVLIGIAVSRRAPSDGDD